MPKSLMRQTQDSVMPKGSAWTVIPGGDNDNFQEGLAANNQDKRDFLEKLAYIRNPQLTPFLSDLEKEYGIVPNSTLTEQERRDRVQAVKTSIKSDATDHFLQEKLRLAGFDVYVHRNSPTIDPSVYLTQNFRAVCGNQASCCGNEEAICGITGGELIVSGDIARQIKASPACCGNQNAVCGNEKALCGYFEGLIDIPLKYDIPVAGYWPLIFFVGGQATRDPVTNEITDIDIADVDSSRRNELIELIIKYKPMFDWCALVAVFS